MGRLTLEWAGKVLHGKRFRIVKNRLWDSHKSLDRLGPFPAVYNVCKFQELPPLPANFQKIVKSRLPGETFGSNPRGLGLAGTLNFNKCYTISPFSRRQSLIYPLNSYKFVGRT